jgi:hypothetical protein
MGQTIGLEGVRPYKSPGMAEKRQVHQVRISCRWQGAAAHRPQNMLGLIYELIFEARRPYIFSYMRPATMCLTGIAFCCHSASSAQQLRSSCQGC